MIKLTVIQKEESESINFLIDYASEIVKQYAAGEIDNIEVVANLKSVHEIDAVLGIITGTLEDIKLHMKLSSIRKNNSHQAGLY